jgi:hypothetical protein
MVFFTATFEKGRIMLYSSGLNIVVWNPEGKASYSSRPGSVDTSSWENAKWHFVVMNWSAKKGIRQIFVDGVASQAQGFDPPAGKSTGIYFNAGDRAPARGVIDEFIVYDGPLTADDIRTKRSDGQRRLREFRPTDPLEVSTVKNLAWTGEVTISPAPNYGMPIYRNTCNGPDDAKQLADGFWNHALFTDNRSVGWIRTSSIILDYDLKTLRRIDAMGVNLGGGSCGTHFPATVNFYAGLTPDTLKHVGEVKTSEPYPGPGGWHGKIAQITKIGQFARFVRFKISGGAFLDEVFVIEQDAKPVFVSFPLKTKTTTP